MKRVHPTDDGALRTEVGAVRRPMKASVWILSGALLGACSSNTGTPAAPIPAPTVVEGTEPPAIEPLPAAVDGGGADDASKPARPETPEEAVVTDRLQAWLSGVFDSKEQSERDPNYFNISLAVCRADAPELGKRVLYVEQARFGSAPYRQRLYVLEAVDASTAKTQVYELASPALAKAAAGACDKATPPKYRALDAEVRVGCEVVMKWNVDHFDGSTVAKQCLSTLNGAAYATTEVRLARESMLSWDRGWDSKDQQVWGSTGAGYQFVRRSAPPAGADGS